jgi:cell division protein FtsQ
MVSINWKKSVFIVCDLAIGVYLLLAVTAFNKPEAKSSVCTAVNINIKDSDMDGFLNADEIKTILTNAKSYPLGKSMQDISPRNIEETLKKSPFVEQAECYKTINGHICINIRQRFPVVRVMAVNGDNYYVDNRGNMMPETRFVTDLIIATGNVSRKYAQTTLARIATHIAQDKFWRNQIVQINVLADGSMEIVPRVGDHIVYLGMPVNVEKKLDRLRKFYLYGLNKAGWNKYSYISVEFNNQIICKKNK